MRCSRDGIVVDAVQHRQRMSGTKERLIERRNWSKQKVPAHFSFHPYVHAMGTSAVTRREPPGMSSVARRASEPPHELDDGMFALADAIDKQTK